MKNIILICAGFICLALGAVGVLIPIMPTTPFVLVSAACFGSSSPKLYKKLKNTEYFGEFLENYEHKSGITKATKLKAILFLWTTLVVSAVIFAKPITIAILLVVGLAVSAHILTIKSKK